MKIAKIDPLKDGEVLKTFLKTAGSALANFRYFDKRSLDIINIHITTLIGFQNNLPICYGHLDREGEHVWLGIAVAEHAQGKGYGKLMMGELINQAGKAGVKNIRLSVDKINVKAIRLYEKNLFVRLSEEENYFIYQLSIA